MGHHNFSTLTGEQRMHGKVTDGGRRVRRFECLVAATLMLASAGVPSASHAADPRYPDWPCAQAKVPDISWAAVWDGPPIDQALSTWQNDPRIKDLVARLAARRTSMEEARTSITDFLDGDGATKADKGTRLFAGLFETLNSQRSEIMNGLERLARREKSLAEEIKSDTSALYELQDKSPPDQTRIDELANQIQWSTRVFEDRRQSIRYACEIPVVIEKRLFALGRAIQQAAEP
jgi:hypothetical protein